MKQEFIDIIERENSRAFAGLFSSLNEEPVVSVRLNAAKPGRALAWTEGCDRVPWEPTGLYLSQRRRFTMDVALHQGRYYVQDASSMIHGEIVRRLARLRNDSPMWVLDCCAAPGGKTIGALAALPEGSAVVANEFDFRRAEILKENIAKWGSANVAVCRGDTARFGKLKGCFDVVIADVPCSGEGMMRKDPVAREQWSRALVNDCVALQREIVENVVGSIMPGGFLVYSTCTFNTEENERNVEFFCERYGLESIDMAWPSEWGIAGAVNSSVHCSRFLPMNLRGEGLFVAVLQKPGEPEKHKVASQGHAASAYAGLCPGLIVEEDKGTVWAMTPSLKALMGTVEKKLGGFISRGVEMGEVKGRDLVPSQALALSGCLAPDAFPCVEVDEVQALNYLRREAVELPSETPRGFVLLTHDGAPLGFVKNLGNRCNNLYPKEWRIRTQFNK